MYCSDKISAVYCDSGNKDQGGILKSVFFELRYFSIPMTRTVVLGKSWKFVKISVGKLT